MTAERSPPPSGASGSAEAESPAAAALTIEIPGALNPAATIWVALSGGLDSSVLLHRLASLNRNRLRAVHVHHGLQAQADDWATHCARLCERLGVAFELRHVVIDAQHAAGPEAAARNARYTALRQGMRAGDCLATAHHRDDQAETLLLRLLRGTGVHGMAAIRPWSEFAPGWLWRPLLDTPRAALRGYAQAQSLTWIEDPQNADARYARSWLRGEILPRLQQRFPQLSERLAQTARLAAEAAGLLDELAELDQAQTQNGLQLKVSSLLALAAPRRHNLLRFWLRARGFVAPSLAMLERITSEVLLAGQAATPCLAWPGCELRRYRDLIYAMLPLPPPPGVASLSWSGDTQLQLPPGCGWLRAATPPPLPIAVRFPQGGECLKPDGSAHARTLKNLFQEAGVPPWLRERTPLIVLEGELAFVAGVGGSARWKDFCAQTGWQSHWLCDAAAAC